MFKKIGDKQTCTIGLYELYRITQLYPQVRSLCNVFSIVVTVCLFTHNFFPVPSFFNILLTTCMLILPYQVDIFSQLQNASEAFRTYISDGIAQVG